MTVPNTAFFFYTIVPLDFSDAYVSHTDKYRAHFVLDVRKEHDIPSIPVCGGLSSMMPGQFSAVFFPVYP